MSKRRVLNITSRKKSDTMMIYTNVIAPRNDLNTDYTTAAAILTGGASGNNNDPYIFLWSPTARDYDTNTADNGKITDNASRTAQTCFMRGLKENCHIQVNNGVPWEWRRIVFTCKGLWISLPATSSQAYYSETSNGYLRTVNEVRNQAWTSLRTVLFKGQQDVDWFEPIIAPTDGKTVSVMYDKTRSLASGNEEGMIRNYKLWHPFNKNLVYGDKESGGETADGHWSTLGKPGMGDVWVCDIFRPRSGADVDDRLIFRPSSTLYWHEK